jgi:hypothetical protein
MKAQILKIAGVKNEKEFYKKFPTEEAFMEKHGKELKKAKSGAWIPGVGFESDIVDISKAIKKKNRIDALNILGNQAGSIVGLSQTIAGNKKRSKQLDQYSEIAKLAGKAAASAPQPPRERYVRPEDQMVQPVNPLGVQGFGYFENGGEIQNTFAPNDIYTDMGYEPLDDRNPKQYDDGGLINTALGNAKFDPSKFMSAAGSLGGGLGSLMGGSGFQQTEEGQLLSTIGGAAGTAFGGPLGGLIGSAAGGLIGGAFGGKKQKEQKIKNQNFQNSVAGIAGSANIQNMFQGNASVRNGGHIASYENGGYMNPEYNPQVIAKFGDYSMDQLLAPPNDADMLRSGGHLAQVDYTPPSARAMYTGRNQMEDGGQMAMGGDLKVHRGKAETMSYNPFLPNGGETIMFRGPSHDNGGMPVSFGENGVEVEGGEPAIKMQDGGQEDNLIVYGNMVIPDYGAAELGDPKAKGKKFKHYVADLSKIEAKQNKLVEKTTQLIDNADTNDQFEKLSLNTGQANLIGTTMKLKDIADKKMNAAAIQNAILDTAEEQGLESDALAKGKIKYAKANDPYAEFGAKIDKFQKGGKKGKVQQKKVEPIELPEFDRTALIQEWIPEENPRNFVKGMMNYPFTQLPEFDQTALIQQLIQSIPEESPYAKRITGITPSPMPEFDEDGNAITPIAQAAVATNPARPASQSTPQFIPGISKLSEQGSPAAFNIGNFIPRGPVPLFHVGIPDKPVPGVWDSVLGKYVAPDLENVTVRGKRLIDDAKTTSGEKEQPVGKNNEEKTNWWETAATFANSLVPYMRPSNQMELEPVQLAPEMFALSDNTLDPVYAQTYQPQYTQPMSISYQDQLNEVTAQTRAAERMAGYDPAAAAAIAGQAGRMKSGILGEQFRANQAERLRAMETNRQTANDAQLKNMAIYQDQADKMAKTRSVLRQQKQVALSSIADKIQKNKLENRQLGIAENMYNYRYTPRGVAYNVNPLQYFNNYGSGQASGDAMNIPSGYEADSYMKTPDGKFIPKTLKLKTSKSKSDDEPVIGRNGSIVKAIKNL